MGPSLRSNFIFWPYNVCSYLKMNKYKGTWALLIGKYLFHDTISMNVLHNIAGTKMVIIAIVCPMLTELPGTSIYYKV